MLGNQPESTSPKNTIQNLTQVTVEVPTERELLDVIPEGTIIPVQDQDQTRHPTSPNNETEEVTVQPQFEVVIEKHEPTLKHHKL